MKLLKKQLLFSLSRGVDFWETVETFEYMNYQQLYWRLKKYSAVSVRGMVSQLSKRGLVDKIVRGKTAKFRLTKMGKDQLKSFFRVAGNNRDKWDRTWRIVIINRGELDLGGRRKLKKILEKLGLTAQEKGIYVTPFGVSQQLREALLTQRLWGAIRLLETKRLVIGDDRAFAGSVWKLNTIYNKYKNLSNLMEGVLYRARRAKSLTYQLKNDYSYGLFSWFKLLLDDPGLPKKLLPDDWPHLETRNLMKKTALAIGELEFEALTQGKSL